MRWRAARDHEGQGLALAEGVDAQVCPRVARGGDVAEDPCLRAVTDRQHPYELTSRESISFTENSNSTASTESTPAHSGQSARYSARNCLASSRRWECVWHTNGRTKESSAGGPERGRAGNPQPQFRVIPDVGTVRWKGGCRQCPRYTHPGSWRPLALLRLAVPRSAGERTWPA